jgi:drug/metabolite transporter (DMT)-like permease
VTQTHLGRVIFWMTGALVAFCTMAVSIRALAGALNVAEILALRSAFGVAVLSAIVALRPELRPALALRRMGLHVVRNALHFAGMYAWAFSLTILPLATVFALEFTTPAWVALIAVPILGERMTLSRAGSVILGFIGVLIIVRPGWASVHYGVLLMLATAVAFAVTLIMTKQLTANASTFAILFWMNVIQLPLGLAGSDMTFLQKLAQAPLAGILGITVGGLASHFCLTNAFRSGDATVVVPLDFLRIPLIALVGWLVYNEPLDLFVFAGAAVIIIGVLWNLHAETRR